MSRRRPPPPEDGPEPPPAAPIGHNHPPAASLDLTPEQWIAWLTSVFGEANKRRAELMASFARFDAGYPISPNSEGEAPHGIEKWSDEIQGRAGDFRDKLQALVKNAEALHTIEKAPVLVAQRAIDGFLRAFREPLDTAIREIRRRQTVYGNWQDAESRRVAREEAERIRVEAEAALAAAAQTLDPDDLQRAADTASEASAAARFAVAAAPEHTRVHGALGSVTSLRKQWTFVPEESDLYELAKAVVLHQAPVSYLAFNETRIKLAIRVEDVRDIPGCKIREEAVAR